MDAMREIQASDAKIHLPEAARRQEEIDRAIEGIKRLRARTGRITTEELLSSRHEGHRY